MVRIEKLAEISESLVSNVRPAETNWMWEMKEQSVPALKIHVQVETLADCLMVHYYCCSSPYIASDYFFAKFILMNY